jgi:hypothetical protein
VNCPAFGVTNRRSPNSSSRYDNDSTQKITALKMFRDMSNSSFSGTWEANYQVVTIGDIFLGFTDGRPGRWS